MFSNMRAKIQAFGGFLTGMVLPNIGAFIAWGIITAFFIPTGWMPDETLGKLVGPMITYLLPILIGYTGGGIVGGHRGSVMGAIATTGVVVGASIPMFMGAMIMGPLGGWVIKKFDNAIEDKIPPGFEMIVNNFSLGILGMILAILGMLGVSPMILWINSMLQTVVSFLLDHQLFSLLAVINEPAKILFLNNAFDHGLYGPLGVQEVATMGHSIFFTLITNPGPGLGLLLAYWVFGQGVSKQTAPSAIIIHFLGGIHELYFPYVLMKPVLIIPMILGGISSILTYQILDFGLLATPSPGSIFAFLALTPKGMLIPALLGVAVSTAVVFFSASFILKISPVSSDLEQAQDTLQKMKLEGKQNLKLQKEEILVVFACDGGVGSSATGATFLKRKLKKEGLDINVQNYAIESIPQNASIVLCHKSLYDRVKLVSPTETIVAIEAYINAPEYEDVVQLLKNSK